jgi:hypothetical protein
MDASLFWCGFLARAKALPQVIAKFPVMGCNKE